MYTKFKKRWIEEQEEEDKDSSDEEGGEKFQLERKQVIPLWKRLNKDGFTPLTLAARLGEAAMFSFLLEERKITQWSFGPVACVLYPLDQVDLEFQQDVNEILFYIKVNFLFLFRMLKHQLVHWNYL
jgi:hypothetical protein